MVGLTFRHQPDSQREEAAQNTVDLVDLVSREMEASLPIFTQYHRTDRPPFRAYLEASWQCACYPKGGRTQGLWNPRALTRVSFTVVFLICALLTPSGFSSVESASLHIASWLSVSSLRRWQLWVKEDFPLKNKVWKTDVDCGENNVSVYLKFS